MQYNNKILIIRNDKLGDFILSLPVFALIRQYYPDTELHAFVPAYTAEIADYCNYIDKVIIDPGKQAPFSEQIATLKSIRSEKYSAIITLFSTTRTGLFSFFSGVRYRLAPATKIAQIFYNQRLVQRRSRSLKPEYKYNLDLAIRYLGDRGISVKELPQPPFLHFPQQEINQIKKDFCHQNRVDNDNRFIFVHPGTGGSATNLSLQQYADLMKNLQVDDNYVFVITAGPGEIENVENLKSLLGDLPCIVYHSTEGLVRFSKLIQTCELFISASTGPLHIAGALNRPTAAFYQRRRSATPLRWQTLNSEDRRLAFTPPEDAHESDLQSIDVVAVARKIRDRFLVD